MVRNTSTILQYIVKVLQILIFMTTSSIEEIEISVPPIHNQHSGKRGDVVVVSSMAADDLSVDTDIRYSSYPPREDVIGVESQITTATSGSSPTFSGTLSSSFPTIPRNLVCILDDYHVDLDMPALYLSSQQVIVHAMDIRHDNEPVILTFMKDLKHKVLIFNLYEN